MTDAPESAPTSPSILIVDDDAVLRTRLSRAFADRGYDVRSAANHDEAVALARQESPEYAVVDLRLPGQSGLDIVRALSEIDPGTNIVVLTGYGSIATAVAAVRLGATHYLTKPADADEILTAFAARGSSPPIPAEEHATPSLARAEWEHIQRVLSDCEGNVSEAARQLKIHRRSLQRKLQKYPPRD